MGESAGPDPALVYRVGSNGLANAAMILGIIGLLLAFVPLSQVVSLILGVLAVVLGGVGLAQASRRGAGRGMAIAGIVLGILAVVISVAIVYETVERIDERIERL